MSNIITKTKSRGVAALLAFLIPPFGLLYSTITGFFFMLLIAPLLWLAIILLFALFRLNEIAVLTFFIAIISYIPICIFWAIKAVNRYNYKLIKKENRLEYGNSKISDNNSALGADFNYYRNNSQNESNINYYIVGCVVFALLLSWALIKRENLESAYLKISNSFKSKSIINSLSGKYNCSDKCIYHSFEFKGESTVIIENFFPSSYVIDKNYIRIKTDKSDLLLKIQDEKTLIGEGFATGTYIKNYNPLINEKQKVNQETKKEGPIIENSILRS